jgi:ribosomal-protein-alanine N-acetyltransferase
MDLHVFTSNEEAVRFYESIGYARVGVAKNFYAQNLNALLYRKTLPA